MSDVNASTSATAPTEVEHAPTDHGAAPEKRTPGAPQPQQEKPRSLGSDALHDLVRNPVFLVSAVLITVLVLMAIAPQLFSSINPRVGGNERCDLAVSRQAPSSHAWFGYDLQGCDVYAHTVYGARASILVGVLASAATLIFGTFMGTMAGFYSGWIDTVMSRVTDVFFALPILLGSMLITSAFPSDENTSALGAILKVVSALAILGWTACARIMRSSVIQVKQADYVQAARALGASGGRVIRRHVLPNAIGPAIVITTISLGGFIGAEATLSFLGIGLQPPAISWGIAISEAQSYIRQSPHMLLFPGAFLSITVLAFIMLGDAVRDAFDPKLR